MDSMGFRINGVIAIGMLFSDISLALIQLDKKWLQFLWNIFRYKSIRKILKR